MATSGNHPAAGSPALKRKGLARTLRRHLIEGLVVIAPLAVTAVVLHWIFVRVDGLLGRFLYPAIEMRIPGLGILTLILLLIVIGWVAERTIGSRLLALWQNLFDRIPVARRIYGTANQIVRTAFSDVERPFQEVVIIEYPSAGRWAIGLVSARAPTAAQDGGPEDRITVFIPNTPNVATGRLVIVPRSEARPLDLTVDQAFTFALSAGTLAPGTEAAPASTESGS